MQLLIVYSVNVLLVVTAFSELAQIFQCFLQMIVDDHLHDPGRTRVVLALLKQFHPWILNFLPLFPVKTKVNIV